MQRETLTHAEPAHRFATGPWIVLIAVLAFVVGSFFPFISFGPPGMGGLRTSLYRELVVGTGRTGLSRAGSFLFFYGGSAVLATIATIELRPRVRTRVAPMLAAGVAVWSVTWGGFLLVTLGVRDKHLLFGFWWVLASLVLATVGAVIALRSGVRSVVPSAAETEPVSQ